MSEQFELAVPKVRLNSDYERALSEITALPYYRKKAIVYNYGDADIIYNESDGKYYISKWEDSLLDDKSQALLKGAEIVSSDEGSIRSKEIRSILKKYNVENYADAYCPYTGILLDVGFPYHLYAEPDRSYHEVSAVPDEDGYVVTGSVTLTRFADYSVNEPTKGKVKSRFSKMDITSSYSKEMVSIMKAEWEKEVLVPSRANLELIKDDVDEVSVYYENIAKSQQKRLYNGWEKGRFYSYKGKRVFVDTPSIENLSKKIEEAINLGADGYYNKHKGINANKSDLFINEVSKILISTSNNEEKMKKISMLLLIEVCS